MVERKNELKIEEKKRRIGWKKITKIRRSKIKRKLESFIVLVNTSLANLCIRLTQETKT